MTFLEIVGVIGIATLVFFILRYCYFYLKDLKEGLWEFYQIKEQNDLAVFELNRANKKREIVLLEMKKETGTLIDRYEYLSKVMDDILKLPIPTESVEEAKDVARKVKFIEHLIRTESSRLERYYTTVFKKERKEDRMLEHLQMPDLFMFHKN